MDVAPLLKHGVRVAIRDVGKRRSRNALLKQLSQVQRLAEPWFRPGQAKNQGQAGRDPFPGARAAHGVNLLPASKGYLDRIARDACTHRSIVLAGITVARSLTAAWTSSKARANESAPVIVS